MKIAVFPLFLALLGCSGVKIGPFVPTDALPCMYDGDCGRHEQCRFPGVNRAPRCMPGENSALP